MVMCSGDPRLPDGRHPLAWGGMSPPHNDHSPVINIIIVKHSKGC